MIKVEFIYKTKKDDLDELMNKFKLSADEKFMSTPTNKGIDMFRKEDGENVYIILDIYYDNIQDYNLRTEYERSMNEWNEIWFNENNKHEEVSVEVFEVLNRF